MEPESVEGDRTTLFKLLGIAGVVILFLLLERLILPDGAARTPDTVQVFGKSVDRLLIVALMPVPLVVGVSIYLVRLGIKVKRSGQWPPPGMRVGSRTKVVRGKRAAWNAILLFILAGFFLIQIPVSLYLWRLVSRLASRLGRHERETR
jgi:hypothetical protein